MAAATDQNKNKRISQWEVETADPHSRSLRLAAHFARVGQSATGHWLRRLLRLVRARTRAGARSAQACARNRDLNHIFLVFRKPGHGCSICDSAAFDGPNAAYGDRSPETARFPALCGPVTAQRGACGYLVVFVVSAPSTGLVARFRQVSAGQDTPTAASWTPLRTRHAACDSACDLRKHRSRPAQRRSPAPQLSAAAQRRSPHRNPRHGWFCRNSPFSAPTRPVGGFSTRAWVFGHLSMFNALNDSVTA